MSVAETMSSHELSTLQERVLWVVWKRRQYACARVRLTPEGPELRVFEWASSEGRSGSDLLYSRIFGDGEGGSRALGEVAELKRQHYVSTGWQMDLEAMDSHIEPYDSTCEH